MVRGSRVALVGMAGVAVLLAGCEAFQAHQNMAAEAAGQTLSVQRLSELVGTAKVVPVRREALQAVAELWVDFNLLAHAMIQGDSLTDSVTLARVAWPDLAQARMDVLHSRLTARIGRLAFERVDSTYRAGELRLVQHILIGVPQGAAPPVKNEKRRRAEQVRRQALGGGGATFAELVSRYSDDSTSKTDSGRLGVRRRGQGWVPSFEQAAWALAPAGVSDVVETPWGFHVIRRPPLSEVRVQFEQGLVDRMADDLDSAFVDSVGRAYRVEVERDAPPAVRATLNDPSGSRQSTRTLATYRGGRFTVGDLVRFLYAYPPQVRQSLPQASDDELKEFLVNTTRAKVLIDALGELQIVVRPEDLRQIRNGFAGQLLFLRNNLGLDSAVLYDRSRPVAERERLAAAAIDQYLERLVAGSTRYLPPSPFLSDLLHERYRWSVSVAGVARALERAQAIRATTDSGRRAATGLQPAPGPAPVPQAPSESPGATPRKGS